MLLTLLSPQTSTLTGTLSRTLDGATLVSSGELVTPSTSSAILIPSSNNPSYRSGFYSPRRGGTPKYPSLWDGCVGAWAPSLGATGGRLFDHSLYQNHGTLTNMDPATDWVVSAGKVALDFDGTDDYVTTEAGKALKSTGSGDATFAAFVRFKDTSRADFLIWKSSSGTPDVSLYSSGFSQLSLYVDNGTWSEINVPTTISTETYYHIAATKQGDSWSLYVNGLLGGTMTRSLSFSSHTDVIWFGSNHTAFSPLSLYNLNGNLDDIRIYSRALSQPEISLLSRRRGIAFERASRKLSLFSAPAPTGSVSRTLANATLSSSGTLASGLNGSVSAVLADATLSATGTLTNAATGGLSSTLADASLLSSGTLSAAASGSVTRTLDSATLSSSGTVGSGLTATVSVTLAAATLSASGTLAAGLAGSTNSTLANATLSSSGTVAAGASGSVTRTLDNATLSATGGAAGSVTGSVSSTLAAVTCLSSATLAAGLSGSVTRALDAVTSSATGTLAAGASGSVTRTLADSTLVSTGSFGAGLTASVNRALDSCVVSSSATVANGATGSLSVQLASATLVSGNVALGGFRLKVAGEWKDAMAFVKVTGTWKNATPFVKVGGVWE